MLFLQIHSITAISTHESLEFANALCFVALPIILTAVVKRMCIVFCECTQSYAMHNYLVERASVLRCLFVLYAQYCI